MQRSPFSLISVHKRHRQLISFTDFVQEFQKPPNLCKFQAALCILVITLPALHPYLTAAGHPWNNNASDSRCSSAGKGERQVWRGVTSVKTVPVWQCKFTYLHCKILGDAVQRQKTGRIQRMISYLGFNALWDHQGSRRRDRLVWWT